MKFEEYRKIYEDAWDMGYQNNSPNHIMYAKHWLPYIDKANPESILDCGCGGGGVVKHLTDKYPDKHIVGIDINSKTIKQNPGCNIIHGSILSLPFDHNAFDMVTSFDVLEHIAPEDINTAIDEIIRVSRRFIIVSVCPAPDFWSRHNNFYTRLHLTIKTVPDWVKFFKDRLNFKLVIVDKVTIANRSFFYEIRK